MHPPLSLKERRRLYYFHENEGVHAEVNLTDMMFSQLTNRGALRVTHFVERLPKNERIFVAVRGIGPDLGKCRRVWGMIQTERFSGDQNGLQWDVLHLFNDEYVGIHLT